MLILYGMTVTVALWVWWFVRNRRLGRYYWLDDPVVEFVFVVVLLGGMVWCGLTFGLSFIAQHQGHKATHNLVALKDASMAEGAFFLGTGYVEGNPSYRYYYQVQDGLVGMGQTPFDDGFVVYDDSAPRLERFAVEFESGLLNHLLIQSVNGNKDYFHVPEGSVINEIKLDLE